VSRVEAEAADIAMREAVSPASIEVSVVIPCLSEEEGIGWAVDRAFEGLARACKRGEVLVVDNGSEDRSAEVAAAHGARVIYEPRRGYGCAYQRGFAEARGEVIAMGDGDGTYDFALLPSFLEALDDGAGLAIGSRLSAVQRGSMPLLHRYLGNPVLSLLFSWWIGLRLSDVYSGMRVFRTCLLRPALMTADGMEFALQMLVLAARQSVTVREVSIPYYSRLGTSKLQTWRDGWRSLRFLLLSSPDFLLLYPGVAATLAGICLLLLTLASDLSVLGHLPWAPSFSSGLCVFLGLQAMAFGSSLRLHLAMHGQAVLRRIDGLFVAIFHGSRSAFVAICLTLCGALARLIPVEGLFRGAVAQLLVISGAQILLWLIFAAALREAGWLPRHQVRMDLRPANDGVAP